MPSEATLVGTEAVVEGAEPDPQRILYQAVVIGKYVMGLLSASPHIV